MSYFLENKRTWDTFIGENPKNMSVLFKHRPVSNWWFITLLAMLVMSCSPKAEPEAFPPLSFSGIDSLAGEVYKFPSQYISLKAPRGIMEITEEDFAVFTSTVSQDSTLFLHTDPLLAGLTADNLFLVISAVSTGQAGLKVFDDSYMHYLARKYPTAEIDRTQFSVNDIQTVQYLISDPTTVAVKLYCMVDSECTQIDYLLPRNLYSSLSRSIEVSIGSISQINEEGTK